MKFNVIMSSQIDGKEILTRTVFKKYRAGQKKVCFTAFVSANLLEIILLAKYYYKPQDYKMLILSDWNCTKDYERIVELGYVLFDEVILIKESGRMTEEDRSKTIRRQMSKVDFVSVDVVHIFAFNQSSFISHIVNYIYPRTKLIQNQYTGASYFVKEYYQSLTKIYPNKSRVILKLLERIDELWIKDRDLIIGDMEGIRVREINFYDKYGNKETMGELCGYLNMYFGYEHEKIENDIIFLEQPLYKFFGRDKEKELLVFKELTNIFDEYGIMLKAHPRCNNSKYDGFNIDKFKNAKVPWEIVLLNEMYLNNLDGKIFLTYFSDSLNTGHMLLSSMGITHYSIRLINLLKGKVEQRIGNEYLDKYQARFNEKYWKDVYDVDDIEDLKSKLNYILAGSIKKDHYIKNRSNIEPYVIGETAYTHEGDLKYMLKLIDMVADLKLDAIKFHLMLNIDSYFDKNHPLKDSIQKYLFTRNDWRIILNYAIRKQLDIIALCDDVESIEFLLAEYKSITAIELHATSLNDVFMLDMVAQFDKEVLLGVGGSSKDELVYAINYLLESNKQEIIMMYGFQSYPTAVEDIDFNRMIEIREDFNLPVGYADHTSFDSTYNAVISVLPHGFGINILEKHIILKSGDTRLDYESALDADDMRMVVDNLNIVNKLMHKMKVSMSKSEQEYGLVGPMKKAILSSRDISMGEILVKEDFKYRRTEGISDLKQRDIDNLIGKRAVRDIPSDTMIDFNMIEDIIYEVEHDGGDCNLGISNSQDDIKKIYDIPAEVIEVSIFDSRDVAEIELDKDKEIIDLDYQGDEDI